MTTSLSTSNPAVPGAAAVPTATPTLPGSFSDGVLTVPIANEFFVALPGATSASLPNIAPAAPANPASASAVPDDEALRHIPAGLAGVSGQSPVNLAQNPSPADADAGFYFLKAVQTTSPGVLPLLRPDRPGFDPTVSSAVPAAVSTANPRAPTAGRSLPGIQQGSTPPHTAGVEIGSQPLAGAVPPASAFSQPSEAQLRALPGVLAGAAGISPNGALAATGSLPYFLDGTPQQPRLPVAVDVLPRTADLELLPDLGLPRSPGQGLPAPGASLYLLDEASRLGSTPR